MNLTRIPLLILFVLNFILTSCGGGSGGGTSPGATSNITNYYVDADSGLDTNNGLSEISAWKTLSKISNTTYTTEAKIFLNRGDVWNEPLILTSSNITLDAYGVGALPKIDGSIAVINWVNVGLGIYSAIVNLDAEQGFGNLSENNIMLNFIPWDNDVSTTFSGAATGSYSFDYLFNTLYIKPATDPNLNAYRASVQLRGIYAKDLKNISIRNIEVSRISLNGIEFHNCENCNVDDATVTRVGGAVIGSNFIPSPDFLYAGNGIDYSNSCSNGSVNNVSVSEVFDSCLAVELYLSNSNAASIALSNAQLDRCGFAGVEISVLSNQGVNTNSTIDGVSVSTVNVDKAGKGWSGRRYGTEGHGLRIISDSGAGTMNNVSVVSTQVSDSAGDGIKLAGEINAVDLQRIRSSKNAEHGINIAAPTASTLRLDLSSSIIDQNTVSGLLYNAPLAAGFQIYHNTFYNNGTINFSVLNQTGIADIRNNLFYSSVPMTHIYSASALRTPTVDNNCYNDQTNMFGYNGTAYSTVAAFNSATGFESFGVGHLSVGLSDPDNDVFTLTSGSSCRGLGIAGTGITSDYVGNTFAVPPSSGALEYVP